MKKAELYKRTVDILYQAYFDDTLEHYNCYACAVGNIVAANVGFQFERVDKEQKGLGWKGFPNQYRYTSFTTLSRTWIDAISYGRLVEYEYYGTAKQHIEATGYTCLELAWIEMAFEDCHRGNSDDEYMFNGLVAVLEVLKEIHEVSDEDATESVKPFKTHYESLKA